MDTVLATLKEIRKEKGYSHEYIAHQLNISQAAYSKLEKNETKLTVDRLYKLAEILEVSVGEILDIQPTNQLSQTNRENSTGYLQQIENFYQESKEQNEKMIQLYEARLQDKDKIIEVLERRINFYAYP